MSRIDSPFYSGPPPAAPSPQPFLNTLNKELQVRHRILAIFNKEEEDFDTKAAWDDYLEEREDIMFNLSQGIDVAAMEAKVRDYQEREGESIGRNEARKLGRALAEEKKKREEETGGRGEEARAAQAVMHEDMVAVGADDRGVQLMGEDEVSDVLRKQTKEEWERMAACSGWKVAWYLTQCQELYAT